MRSIYIIQAHTGTIPSKVIKLATNYKYSHILLSLDNSFNKMYSFGRRKVYNPLNAGFVVESKNGDFYTRFNRTECRVFEIEISEKQFNKLNKILLNFENNSSDYNYDIIGLIFKFFNISFKRKNHYVCSQFVAEIIDECNIYKFNKKIELVRPKDFEYIPNLNILYNGLINYINLEI